MPKAVQTSEPAGKAKRKLSVNAAKKASAGVKEKGRTVRRGPKHSSTARTVEGEPAWDGMITSKLSARSQTTLPRAVRERLNLEPGQRLGYVIEGDRVRLINPAELWRGDPAIQRFLKLLGHHMQTHPEDALLPFPDALLTRARAMTAGIVIDHDAPIDGTVSL